MQQPPAGLLDESYGDLDSFDEEDEDDDDDAQDDG